MLTRDSHGDHLPLASRRVSWRGAKNNESPA
jgi:hypothetical protein